MVLLCRFLFKQKIINCVEALYQGRYYIVHLLHVRDSDTTKMRMVRYFEHISGMLRQQSKLTKSDGNHGRNKKIEIFRYRKRQHGERERERERECLRCTDKALYKCTKIELSLSPIILLKIRRFYIDWRCNVIFVILKLILCLVPKMTKL